MAIDICARLGKRIRRLRKERNWTQEYLSQHSGLGSVYLSRLENGQKEPGLRTLEILANAFDLSPSQLLRNL